MVAFDARDFDKKMSKGVLRNVYPFLARRILERTGIKTGRCIDLGGGPGMLGIRMAEISDLDVTVYDPTPECIEIAEENIAEHGLSQRMRAIEGAAEHIRFAKDSVDLIVSRGSIYFWDDQAKGLAEIHRVLKAGGWAFVGGGMGNADLAAEVDAARARNPEIRESPWRKLSPVDLKALLGQLGIDGMVESDAGGTWIVFQKTRGPA
ncbi:MAG TPA: class I SAM-dependent methyltransferase [Telmatospirillum sp.]|nr:class I SAM-dependent methyltransferase [Telmatospirillum sp.]